MSNELVVLRTSYGSEKDANAAAKRIIKSRIAACAQVWPVNSTYRWQGKIVAEKEWLLEAKTPHSDQDLLWDALLEGHPYETPCVEIVGVVVVPARYHQWAARATNRD